MKHATGIVEYVPEKMTGTLEKIYDMRIFVAGVGAVGSHIAEALYQHGVGIRNGHLYLNDYDHVDNSNYTKQSGVYKAADLGKSKAQALADNINEVVGRADYAVPLNMDICDLGAEFFVDFDALFIAVDNFKARMHINKVLKHCSKTPVVFTTGTGSNKAESICLDMKKLCTRCLWSEKWLEGEKVPTGCRFAYETQIKAGTTPTSKMLSAFAGLLAFAQFSAWVEGHEEVLNKRKEIVITDDGVDLHTSRPLPKPGCPDCNLAGDPNLKRLPGSVYTMTLRQLFEVLRKELGPDQDFQIPLDSGGFLLEDFCPVCGRQKTVNRPARRVKQESLICEECHGKRRKTDLPNPIALTEFTFDTPDAVLDMTLFDLGFRVKGYIAAESIIDLWADDDEEIRHWFFYLDESEGDGT